jgi:hypothetical protein
MASIAPDETLEARKAALTEQLEAMHLAPDVVELVARADAAFQARKAKFADIEEQIANLDREIGARERTRRADAERERQDRWQAQRAELVAEADVFLGAIAAAESATRDLVRALDVIIASNGPTAANPMELVSLMAGRIASVMSTVKGHRNRLGPLDWPGGLVGLFPSNVSWREAKRLEAALVQPILTKGKA